MSDMALPTVINPLRITVKIHHSNCLNFLKTYCIIYYFNNSSYTKNCNIEKLKVTGAFPCLETMSANTSSACPGFVCLSLKHKILK